MHRTHTPMRMQTAHDWVRVSADAVTSVGCALSRDICGNRRQSGLGLHAVGVGDEEQTARGTAAKTAGKVLVTSRAYWRYCSWVQCWSAGARVRMPSGPILLLLRLLNSSAPCSGPSAVFPYVRRGERAA